MKNGNKVRIALFLAAIVASSAFSFRVSADDSKEDVIKQVMKDFHKAPKGTDPVCKKALDGKASPEELKKLIAGYKAMIAAKPPKGDEASWKEKTTKLCAAAQGLEKGGAEAQAKYKAAVDCKGCHSVHKPN